MPLYWVNDPDWPTDDYLIENWKIIMLNRRDTVGCTVIVRGERDTGYIERCGKPEYTLCSNKCLAHWQYEKGLI